MTKSEAIKILLKNKVGLESNPNVLVDQCLYEALDMAIVALESQKRNCETCIHSNNGECAFTEECHECMWKSKYEQQPTTKNHVVALDFSDDIDTPNKYQTVDGKWHEGRIPDTEPNERDCENCVHKKLVEIKGTFVYCCEKWNCEFESKDGDDE